MATKFFLILSGMSSPIRYELTAAISGDADGWNGTSRYFASRAEVEAALRNSKVLPAVGPNQSLDAAASNISVAFALESAAPAIALQVLCRVDPQAKLEKTMVTFNDLSGSFPYSTAQYQREHPITVERYWRSTLPWEGALSRFSTSPKMRFYLTGQTTLAVRSE